MRVNFTVDVLIVVIFRGGGILIFGFCMMRFDYFCTLKIKKTAVLVGTTQKLVGMYFKCTRHSAKEN